MTGFDPTAPERDTSQDAPDQVEGNVVPPESLTGRDGAGADEAAVNDPDEDGPGHQRAEPMGGDDELLSGQVGPTGGSD